MVIVHRDNQVYKVDQMADTAVRKLCEFYSTKFKSILESFNIPYKFTDYEDYTGNYFVGRFAQADVKYHSKVYNKLYNYYGENMWPNKKTYDVYNNKIKEYDIIKKYDRVPNTIICNTIEDLYKNIEVGMVVKSSHGAGSEQVFYIYKKEQIENLEKYILGCNLPNIKPFFPCIITEYIDVDYEYKIIITHDEIYGVKVRQFKDFETPNMFPHNIDYEKVHWGLRDVPPTLPMEEKDYDLELLNIIRDIKKELNTPNLKFDIMGNKIIEFSYIYGELLPLYSEYCYYDLIEETFKYKKTSIREFSNKQNYSVLKHFGII